MADIISPFISNLLIIIGIYIILGVSLNLALGFTGLLNLGHVAFFAIGAYVSALLTVNLGVPFVFGFVAAGLVSGVFGFALIFATKKLKGDYLALATLGFAFVIVSLLLNLQGLTRGPLGIPGIAKPDIFGFVFNTNTEFLIFISVIAVVSVFVMNRIIKSPFGKLLEATRDDEIGLRILGKNTDKIKYKSMAISAFFAGIAGSLFAHYISFIEPNSFFISEIILVLTIVIMGGIASIRGSVAAAFIVVLIPEVLRFLGLPTSVIGPIRQIIYAVLLLFILLLRPRGLFGRIDLK